MKVSLGFSLCILNLAPLWVWLKPSVSEDLGPYRFFLVSQMNPAVRGLLMIRSSSFIYMTLCRSNWGYNFPLPNSNKLSFMLSILPPPNSILTICNEHLSWVFSFCRSEKVGWLSLSSRLKQKLLKPFCDSYNFFKDRFFRVCPSEIGPNFLVDSSGNPFFPLH
ncbi:hypothetical protein CR513_40642, partial [Mucuna pruriens]